MDIFIFILFINFIILMKSSETSFNINPNLFDPSQKETMGLEYAPGIKTVKVFQLQTIQIIIIMV